MERKGDQLYKKWFSFATPICLCNTNRVSSLHSYVNTRTYSRDLHTYTCEALDTRATDEVLKGYFLGVKIVFPGYNIKLYEYHWQIALFWALHADKGMQKWIRIMSMTSPFLNRGRRKARVLGQSNNRERTFCSLSYEK